MSDVARRDEIDALLKSHPAIRAWQRREEHVRALQYLYVNAEGLIALIDQLNEDGLGLLLMSQSPVPDEDDEAWRLFLIELGRRWRNYAASAVTVVDHTRRLMEGESTSFSEQCAAAREVQLDNPVIQFTHRSRVYLLHLGVFNPTVRMQLVAGKRGKATHAFSVVMRTEVMLHRYAEWGAKGREYVKSRSPLFDLRSSVQEYMDTVRPFHEWFADAYDAEHRGEAEEMLALLKELAVLEGRDPAEVDRLAGG